MICDFLICDVWICEVVINLHFSGFQLINFQTDKFRNPTAQYSPTVEGLPRLDGNPFYPARRVKRLEAGGEQMPGSDLMITAPKYNL